MYRLCRVIPWAFAAMLLVSANLAIAAGQQLVVVTSFPNDLTGAFKRAFEQKPPNIREIG